MAFENVDYEFAGLREPGKTTRSGTIDNAASFLVGGILDGSPIVADGPLLKRKDISLSY